MFKLKDISWIFITILVTLQNSQNLTVASPEFANLLQVFQSCLIVLLDYAKTNWTVSSSIPIIRFKLKVNAYLRTDTNSSGDEMLYAYIDGRTVALKPIPRILCAVEFHLYPPIQSGQLKNSLKTTDLLRLAPERDLYHEGNDEYSKFLFKTWENTYYRILVTGVFDSIKWTAWAAFHINVKKMSLLNPSLLCILALPEARSSFNRQGHNRTILLYL